MIVIASPLAGWVTPLEAVPDPVFAERMLGEGIAIDPVEGRLVAPAAGLVETLHEAGHALSLACDEGPVLLMHVGIDTVALGGEGFAPQVKAGQRVSRGDTLILFDLDLLARKARSLVTPVIVTNGDAFLVTAQATEGPIVAGDPLCSLKHRDSGQAQAMVEANVFRSLRLQLAHGLHARPAARLSKAISGFDAQAEIVAPDGRSAPVFSPVAMLGLRLRHGAEITIRAGGPDAERALGALVDLLDSGMGELLPLHEREPAAAVITQVSGVPSQIRGVAAVPGTAIGPCWRLKVEEFELLERSDDPDRERRSLAAARAKVERSLEKEARGGGPGAAIAEAHLAMISDPMLDAVAQRLIASGKTAAFAWREVIRQSAAPLRTSTDARFAERLDDLLDLERRLLGELMGEPHHRSSAPAGAIVVTETLYPSQLQELAKTGIAGLATSAGGATSHAAIIAAGLALPMVVGLGPQLALLEDGTELILRGDTILVAPDSQLLGKARSEVAARAARRRAAQARALDLAVTADGTRIEVFANLGSIAEASVAVQAGAEGCGLLRTEFLFLERDAPPSEAEQRSTYQSIADVLGERPLIVRTLDIGADKPAAWLPMQSEDNPALGLRGIRLQLARKDLLETQLRALLGVQARGSLRIMLPMISSLGEIRETGELLSRLATEMQVEAPDLGIMVETPAAALTAEELAAEAAFLSIGSNDLSQYTLARDRTNPAVASGLDGLEPAVLRLIAESARGARAHGRITGVCGGLAAVPEAIPVLVGLGVTELSVPPGAIAEVKAIVRSLDLPHCRELARQALAAPDGDSVRALVGPTLEQTG